MIHDIRVSYENYLLFVVINFNIYIVVFLTVGVILYEFTDLINSDSDMIYHMICYMLWNNMILTNKLSYSSQFSHHVRCLRFFLSSCLHYLFILRTFFADFLKLNLQLKKTIKLTSNHNSHLRLSIEFLTVRNT